MSYTDLSTWCYLCDDYINDPAIAPALFLLHLTKFKTPHPSDHNELYFSRFYCNVCTKNIKGVLYHCKECEDYDMCKECFEKEEYGDPHELSHTVEIRRLDR